MELERDLAGRNGNGRCGEVSMSREVLVGLVETMNGGAERMADSSPAGGVKNEVVQSTDSLRKG